LHQLGYRGWFSLEMRMPADHIVDEIATRLSDTARALAD
jgi:hypothetical protein